MTDLLAYFTIADPEDRYRFSAGYDFKKRRYYMPSLSFTEITDKEYPDQELVWDNPEYLYNLFYKFLNDFKNRETGKAQKEEFAEILHILEEDCEVLIDILDQGRQLGWDKL